VTGLYDSAGHATNCPAGQPCTTPPVEDPNPPPDTSSTGSVRAFNGNNDTTVTATWGDTPAPMLCEDPDDPHTSVLTVNGDRAKLIKVVFSSPLVATQKTNKVCFGAPYRFTGQNKKLAKWNAANHEWEGYLRGCSNNRAANAPCVTGIAWSGGTETVWVYVDTRDPRLIL
jgi:hypothetical protein